MKYFSLLVILPFCISETLTTEELEGILRLAREYSHGKNQDIKKAHKFYTEVIEKGNGKSYVDALYEISNLSGQSVNQSLYFLTKSADLGHQLAQHKLAVAYDVGVYNGIVPIDAERSLFLEYFSALSGNAIAHMAMGYRYYTGNGVPQSCQKALLFYEYAANVAAAQYEDRLYEHFIDRTRLGEKIDRVAKSNGITQEMIDYHEHLAGEANIHSLMALATIYQHGSEIVEQDVGKATRYLKEAAALGNPTAAGMLGYYLAQRGVGVKERMVRSILHSINEKAKEDDIDDSDDEVTHELHASDHERDGNAKAKESSSEDGVVNEDEISQEFIDSLDDDDDTDDLSELDKIEIIDDMTEVGDEEDTKDEILSLVRFSANRGDMHGLLGLGYCYYKGYGVDKNLTKAIEFFQRANGKLPDAGFYIGEILMGAGGRFSMSGEKDDLTMIMVDAVQAAGFYGNAAARGHYLATHRLGHVTAYGLGTPKSCKSALIAFKSVAERGDWAVDLRRAVKKYESGDQMGAFSLYANLASMGYEVAEANAAHILTRGICPDFIMPTKQLLESGDPKESVGKVGEDGEDATDVVDAVSNDQPEAVYSGAFLPPSKWKDIIDTLQSENYSEGVTSSIPQYHRSVACEARALRLLQASAKQGNSESYLKVGDMNYYGRGGLQVNKPAAAGFYQLAADMRQPQAMFNLGLMYQLGDGIPQDFHLAKRFYDQSAEYDKDASFPSYLAVKVLQFHQWLEDTAGQKIVSKIGDILAGVAAPFAAITTSKIMYSNNIDIYDPHASMSWQYLVRWYVVEPLAHVKRILFGDMVGDQLFIESYLDDLLKKSQKIYLDASPSHDHGEHSAEKNGNEEVANKPKKVKDVENEVKEEYSVAEKLVALSVLLLVLFDLRRVRRQRLNIMQNGDPNITSMLLFSLFVIIAASILS